MPRHSTVVAYLALFIALGGTSYAAVKLPANSVTSTQIKAGTIQTSDLARKARPKSTRALAGDKLFLNAVATEVVSTDQVLTALKDATKGDRGDTVVGPAGAPGANGANGKDGQSIQGPQGEQGPQGVKGVAVGYAKVNGDGTLEPGLNRNVSISHTPGSSSYCVRATEGVTATATATVDGAVVGDRLYPDPAVFVQLGAPGDCNGFEVETRRQEGNFAEVPFFVTLN